LEQRDRKNSVGRVPARTAREKMSKTRVHQNLETSERLGGLIARRRRRRELTIGRHGGESDEANETDDGCKQTLHVHSRILSFGLESEKVYTLPELASSLKLLFFEFGGPVSLRLAMAHRGGVRVFPVQGGIFLSSPKPLNCFFSRP